MLVCARRAISAGPWGCHPSGDLASAPARPTHTDAHPFPPFPPSPPDASTTPEAGNLPFELSANYTTLSAGMYIWDAPLLLQLCADSSVPGDVPGTKLVLFKGSYSSFPVTLCLMAGVVDKGDGTTDFRFNLSQDLISCIGGSTACCPRGAFPSEYQLPDFVSGVSPKSVNQCPTKNVMPTILRGQGAVTRAVVQVPIALPSVNGVYAGQLSIEDDSVSQSILDIMIVAAMCPSTATPLAGGERNAFQVIFNGTSANWTVCSWMKREDNGTLVIEGFEYGQPCPTAWTAAAIRLPGFYPSLTPVASGAEGVGVGWAVVAAALAVVTAAVSSSGGRGDEEGGPLWR
jgi:hypothetical protein